MEEYISKVDAVDAVEYANGNMTWAERDDCKKRLEELSPADVAPVRHARWERYSGITIRCSRCEHVIHDWRLSECKYCPNCGAKMDDRDILTLLLVVMMFLVGIAIGGHLLF